MSEPPRKKAKQQSLRAFFTAPATSSTASPREISVDKESVDISVDYISETHVNSTSDPDAHSEVNQDLPVSTFRATATENDDSSRNKTDLDLTENIDDIGLFLDNGRFDANCLSDKQKYFLLKHHGNPPVNFEFPLTKFGKQSRKASHAHIKGTFVYSKQDDSIWCLHCALFVDFKQQKSIEKNHLVNIGFKNWKKINEKQESHLQCKYHQSATVAASSFISNFEKPERNISCLLNKEVSDRSPTYRDIACLLAQAVHYCGRQDIALRGHRENLESEGKPGNFLALVKLLADHNPVLKRHLESAET